METMILIAQTGAVAICASWLLIGVCDNIIHPDMNRVFVAQVLQLDRIREQFPDDFARIAHRAITSRGIQDAMFRLIVLVEILVCLGLWISAVWMVMAIFGQANPASARTAAMAGVLGFTAIWAGFLVVGNYFAYWYCHEGAQNTHFQLVLMGIGTMIFLAVG